MTDVKLYVLNKSTLLGILANYPKISYYAKRWTQWELVREYIRTYSRLYYTAAQRGASMNPPLLSKRPFDGELDDIDVAVLDHLQDLGF